MICLRLEGCGSRIEVVHIVPSFSELATAPRIAVLDNSL